jgi:molybdopterin-containing oxidoreductase family iron-sulfur binding subunit
MSSMNDQFDRIEEARERPTHAPGKRYWRGIEELADSKDLEDHVKQEFPEWAGRWTDPLTRRQFLVLMGASLALAGMGGCSVQPPVGKIVPYARQPEEIVPGRPQFFATAMPRFGGAIGLVVKSREGRPIKVEGNPRHPASLGATDAFAQAAVLGLYDPDRSQAITYLGQPRTWSEAKLALRAELEELRRKKGVGLRILTETVVSPSLLDQLAGAEAAAALSQFPQAKWYQYDAARSDAVLRGTEFAFGERLNAMCVFSKADVVVALDADFLADPSKGLRYTRDFMSRRRVSEAADRTSMSRLYVTECMPSITGAKADHRLPVPARRIVELARGLASELDIAGVKQSSHLSDQERGFVNAVAKDLRAHRGRSIVLAGDGQPAPVHAIVHAINDSLGKAGKSVVYIDPIEARPTQQLVELRDLAQEMEAGDVRVLVILGGNPVFTAPADLEFDKHLENVPLRVHLGLYHDESAARCQWHIPEAHFLESWSDARAYDGTASIVQPLIAPLYGGRSAHEVVSALFDVAERPGYEIVRGYWRNHWPGSSGSSNFERKWEEALHDGLIEGTAFSPRRGIKLRADWIERSGVNAAPPSSDSNSYEITFHADPTIYDGRYADNGWLQELPKPTSKITWDNAAFVGPATAEKLGLQQTFGDSAGEHGQAIVDVLELDLHGRTVEAPVWMLPGHAEGAITVHFGYGRTQAGRMGTGVGFDAYRLRTADAAWFEQGLRVGRTGKRYTLACTQMHHSMEGREPVRELTYEEFLGGKLPREESIDQEQDPRLKPASLYPQYDYGPPKNKWGMSIDLTACTGCSACVAACQAENNIPVVGKTEVTRGREMHWLRIDRYYSGPADEPVTHFQPVPCMHCENAPCELVCPVGATVHSADGLNDMVYNRCVGTRYCSNNCPYKVRRFNFFQYADFETEVLKLGRNPEVTVRSRGVMEKCTYCVQRIRGAQIDAEIAGRAIRDGDVLTACQQACPAQAIIFGDMNDNASEVVKRKALSLDYSLLAELNTRPRTTYLAALRNPIPELKTDKNRVQS